MQRTRGQILTVGAIAALGALILWANVAAAPVPPIDKPVMFDTPEADKILENLQIFPPDNPWNQDVSEWPVHPNSQAIITAMGAAKPLRNNRDMSFIFVPPQQPRVPVKINRYPDESDKGPFPVPDNMPIEGWPANFQIMKHITLADVQRDKILEGGDRHAAPVDAGRVLGARGPQRPAVRVVGGGVAGAVGRGQSRRA